jgi:tRNA pseudouridine55 synthase
MEIKENQIILIDKPKYWTSFDVVKKIKIGHKLKKIGHGGTLDPLATGLLVLATGKETKNLSNILALSKTYQAEFILGATTPSLDTEFYPEKIEDCSAIGKETLLEKINSNFTGKINQKPPLFSAVKINGQRAYKLARIGKKENKDEPKEKPVTIYDFTVISIEYLDSNNLLDKHFGYNVYSKPSEQNIYEKKKVRLNHPTFFNSEEKIENLAQRVSFPGKVILVKSQITCSSGTYIRSLAGDLGNSLQTSGYLLSLQRISIGDHTLQNAQKII